MILVYYILVDRICTFFEQNLEIYRGLNKDGSKKKKKILLFPLMSMKNSYLGFS